MRPADAVSRVAGLRCGDRLVLRRQHYAVTLGSCTRFSSEAQRSGGTKKKGGPRPGAGVQLSKVGVTTRGFLGHCESGARPNLRKESRQGPWSTASRP